MCYNGFEVYHMKLFYDRKAKDPTYYAQQEGIRSVGILEMELYIFGNKVVMIVETPLDFDWKFAMDKLAGLPRQAEWEAFVAQFQGCDANATSAQKWQLMERMFYLYED